ncbi:uncharacterized protein KIAA2012 homolog [Pempheris klunzingeri]|uniref:uncharacterized protein KIAA2012 homolog n=1 Tax=Pempheris klunzingeri TaxID=3127111 RepID=UPI00397F9E98
MQDLSLSLLSRGCGRFISSNGNTGRHDGRLDVCFTPQDYYLWRSQDSLLRLSDSSRLEAESTLPKTYSTRRGALLLYSQDLVTMETSCHSETRERKQRVVRRHTRQVEPQLSTLKELTAAILGYCNSQFTSSPSSRLAPPFFPPLHHPTPPPPPIRATRQQPSPALPAQLNPQRLPAETTTQQQEHEDKEADQGIRLDLFLHIPCTSRTPTPQAEPPPWVHHAGRTPEEPDETQLTWGGPGTDEDHTLRLPPIAGSHALTPSRATQPHTQQDARPKAERTGLQSQDNVQRLHQQRLFVPLLSSSCLSGEMCGKQSRGGEKSETQYFKKETVRGGGGEGGGGGGGGRLPSEKGSLILLEPGGEPPPPAGALGCVAGRKGPGRQSSLAFLQNRLPDLQDPCESSQSDANRGVVRGVLPLELRDLQNKPVGSLLLGPDGEIVQLSLYENHRDSAHTDGDTQGEALQVLSTQGQKLPWIIVLQPEPAHTDGEELLPDVPAGDSQLRQSSHKRLDLQRPTETNTPSPSSHTDPVDVTKENTKRAEAETWRRPKKGAKSVRMPPLRERVGREEPGGGNTGPEEEDEEEEEELGHTGENLQVKEDESISQQSINPNEEQTEGTVDPSRTRTKRRDTEGAAESSGDMTAVKSAESDGQKALGMKKEGRQQRQKTVSDAQSKRSQKQAVRSSRGAAETLEQSALPAVKKRMTDRGGERGEGSRQRKSAGRRTRRTRGRQQHKELAVEPEEPLEKEEVDVTQEMEEEAHRKSTESSSATLRHTKKTNPPPEADADRRPTSADVHSSGSLGSTGAASQPDQRSSRRSVASSCEGAAPASAAGLSPSRGRLSSCSAVMVPEEQLMLNPVKPEASRSRQNEDEEAAALRLAQRAERRRQEVERKRREREEEERKQREREQTEDRMKSELDEERKRRAEEHRLKRLAEEEERRRRDEEEQERARREEAQRERERRRQEERRRQMERFQRMREEEEQRRRAELELLRREEERRREEETRRIQEMDEGERVEYLGKKQQEEEERRNKEEERVRREEEEALQAAEEGRLQAASLARQAALLQQHLAFKRGLVLEAGGLEKTQGISRPWIYSYFTLLQLLGLNPAEAETKTPDL